MKMALRQSQLALEMKQMPFGAVVVGVKGEPLGEGHNRVQIDLDPTAHGEISAIRSAWANAGDWRSLIGSTIYSSCEPCLLCTWVITQMGARRVVFAARGSDVPTYRPLLGKDLKGAVTWLNAQRDWTHLEVVGDFMREEAVKQLRSYSWKDEYSSKPKRKD